MIIQTTSTNHPHSGRVNDGDVQMDSTEHSPLPAPTPAAPSQDGPKRRPRLDLTAEPRKRGAKSMFGIVLGTLNKAKVEDKQRNASEAVSFHFYAGLLPFAYSPYRPRRDRCSKLGYMLNSQKRQMQSGVLKKQNGTAFSQTERRRNWCSKMASYVSLFATTAWT